MSSQEIPPDIERFARLIDSLLWFYPLLWILAGIVLISSLVSIPILWSIVKNTRGADRLTWIIVVLIPLFGPFAFLVLYQKEREEDWLNKHSAKASR